MNHRRSPGGYHSRLVPGILVAACLPARAVVPPAQLAPPPAAERWRVERRAVVAQINAARGELGVPALAYDARLERVGDAHCARLIAEGGDGHFASDGVAPYLRWLLAGGSGFHRENVGSYSTTGTIVEAGLGAILARSVASMLDEVPPEDGHRRALLDPWVTHIGVGLAWQGGEVRMTHELATEVVESWTPPPAVAAPRTRVALAGRLPGGWEAGAVESLWEELPRPLAPDRLRALRSYAYPPRRAMAYANRSAGEGETTFPRPDGEEAAPFAVGRRGSFSYRWTTGPHDGVEIVVLWARLGSDRPFVPVAASATVVVETAVLPPALAFWRELGRGPEVPGKGAP